MRRLWYVIILHIFRNVYRSFYTKLNRNSFFFHLRSLNLISLPFFSFHFIPSHLHGLVPFPSPPHRCRLPFPSLPCSSKHALHFNSRLPSNPPPHSPFRIPSPISSFPSALSHPIVLHSSLDYHYLNLPVFFFARFSNYRFLFFLLVLCVSYVQECCLFSIYLFVHFRCVIRLMSSCVVRCIIPAVSLFSSLMLPCSVPLVFILLPFDVVPLSPFSSYTPPPS